MANVEYKVTIKTRKTIYWYLTKLVALINSPRLFKLLNGKCIMKYWINGELTCLRFGYTGDAVNVY